MGSTGAGRQSRGSGVDWRETSESFELVSGRKAAVPAAISLAVGGFIALAGYIAGEWLVMIPTLFCVGLAILFVRGNEVRRTLLSRAACTTVTRGMRHQARVEQFRHQDIHHIGLHTDEVDLGRGARVLRSTL